jgi:hypothetical protein
MVDQSFYKRHLDPVKTHAEKEVRDALGKIASEFSVAIATLTAADNKPEIDVATIERSLTHARDEWLSSMKAVFDDAIKHLKSTLTESLR